MKNLFIKDLKAGDTFDSVPFGINKIHVSEDKNGRPYWSVELLDKSGVITGKVWSEAVAQVSNAGVKVGDICAITGVTGEFRGQVQINIQGISKLTEDQYSIEDYVRHTDEDIKELDTKIKSYIGIIGDDELRALMEGLYEFYSEDYLRWPAATRNHHNFVGGLAEHVVEMLEVADVMLRHYPEASPDLVYAGVILHDIGKLRELEMSGFVFNYTAEGKLLGHITIGVNMVEAFIQKHFQQFAELQTSFKLALLKHIILSHHSKLEFGSPVRPGTIEAGIVSKLDVLSSEVRIFQRVLTENQSSGNDFSAGEFSLDRAEVFLRSQEVVKTKTASNKTTGKTGKSQFSQTETQQDTLL